MDYAKESLRLHGEWKGKIEVVATVPVATKDDLSLAYTPGVAQPCLEIQKNIEKSYELTRRHNLCAVITDGSAVLGLGDIGPEAGMPVMEGKCVLFKSFGGVDAFPLCIKTQDVDEFVNAVYLISGSFGGINLEDISAPRCFEIERKLKQKCDIPIFHDDQHGTAIITLAGLTNALKVVGKRKEDVKVVTSGAGAAAVSIVKLLLSAGYRNITMCDRNGIIYSGREKGMNWIKEEMAQVTNPEGKRGTLADALVGADAFIGVSAPGMVTTDMVKTMAKDSIIFACANPTPEIFPDEAKAGGARVISTGRSDFPNQINNVLAFPGVFRGAFDVRASDINEEMKMAAAQALSSLISDDELNEEYIIPKAFDPRVGKAVAEAVAEAARRTGVARI
ncbi:MAG: NAD-dependent malic enzyme [Eubacteriales bacterium]|nr:NAD-dependent malic enzyme [Eubacteriales bacterium]MCI7570850.1 NAD-dependent malic enzyme [Clostridiales bacterium]MDD7550422.1 NAD-dependent malic enzyme [Clostridia bacterium]MDY5754556.1 malic enzyme-like NAD(P)-binding protein [Eubacteriales bacterium]